MKHNMRRILVLALTMLLLCLAGCSGGEVLGKWERNGNLGWDQRTDILSVLPMSNGDREFLAPVEMMYRETLHLNEDGTYLVEISGDTLETDLRIYIEDLFVYAYEHRVELDSRYADADVEQEVFLQGMAVLLGYSDFFQLQTAFMEQAMMLFPDGVVLEQGQYSVRFDNITFTPEGGDAYKVSYEIVEPWGYLNLWYDDDTVSLHTRK